MAALDVAALAVAAVALVAAVVAAPVLVLEALRVPAPAEVQAGLAPDATSNDGNGSSSSNHQQSRPRLANNKQSKKK